MKIIKYHRHPSAITVITRAINALFWLSPKGIDKVCILFIMRKIKEVR